MTRTITSLVALALTLATVVGWAAADPTGPGRPAPQPVQVAQVPPPVAPAIPVRPRGRLGEPIVISEGQITIIAKQDVPSQRDGVLVKVCVEVGQTVKSGQVLGILNTDLAQADCAIKQAKIVASKADLVASEKTLEESKKRAETATKLVAQKVLSFEEYRGAVLTVDRYVSEVASKKEGVTLAELESSQAEIVLGMHQIKSTAAGVIKSILKQEGEAVKNLEPVFQIQNFDKFRVEGLLEVQYLPRILKSNEQGLLEPRVGKVLVEPSHPISPESRNGHLQEITCVAVSKDARQPLVVSASRDGTVRVWDRDRHSERVVFQHPDPVLAVACTPPGARANLCLTGDQDGKGRLFDLASGSDQPVRELKGQHRGGVNAVAFSTDGKLCATGDAENKIRLWDAGSGDLIYLFPVGHRGAITSLQFTPDGRLVSAATDKTLRVWQVGAEKAELLKTFDRQGGGEVGVLGVSPDGKRAMFDQGKTLRALTIPDGRTDSVIRSAGGTSSFANFALFSPDGQMVVTAGASEGRLQLWRVPGGMERVSEVRQMVPPDRSVATCAAFAPDGSFLVTGTRDRQVFFWPLPAKKEELDCALPAELKLVERDISSSSRQVRVWVELRNVNGSLNPGNTATIVIYPEE
jgi:WD40 repeat protein/biotin carboxyl carrier protein